MSDASTVANEEDVDACATRSTHVEPAPSEESVAVTGSGSPAETFADGAETVGAVKARVANEPVAVDQPPRSFSALTRT